MSDAPLPKLIVPDFGTEPPATEAQLEYLDKLDVFYPLNVTKREASRLIAEALEEQ